jgi:hypothetical protein
MALDDIDACTAVLLPLCAPLTFIVQHDILPWLFRRESAVFVEVFQYQDLSMSKQCHMHFGSNTSRAIAA